MFWVALLHPRWTPHHEEVEYRFERILSKVGDGAAEDIRSWAPGWTKALDGDLGFAANRIIGLPHGTRENRRYGKRLQLLQEHGFDPAHHLDRQAVALEWHQAPSGLAEAVANYFQERDEDAPESA